MEVDGKRKKAFTSIPYELKRIQQEAVWNGVLHPESEWAYVKPLGAKNAMRECYKDYGRFKGQAKKLKEYILSDKKSKYELFVSHFKDDEATEEWLKMLNDVEKDS